MNNTNFPSILQSFEGSFVEVIVVGAIRVPYYFDRFEICVTKDIIYFGQYDCEQYMFRLIPNTFEIVTTDEDFVKLKIDYDGMITYLEITKH
jgi:hypothetical protein